MAGTVAPLGQSSERDPLVAGALTIERVATFVARLPVLLRRHADELISRHGYVAGEGGSGPHSNVLGHPLFQLPIWVDAATDGRLETDILMDILESGLCGYLSVRAEDDYFDGEWRDAKAAMMLAGVFRVRHQALLASHVGDTVFWARFEEVWRGYAEAMLYESELKDGAAEYGSEEHDRVLLRSQPLEIPADAVLSLKGRWDQAAITADLVRHLTRATQLFDDFVDAPADLASGNHTWMVRRLGGLAGATALRRGMVTDCDAVFAEAFDQLDQAVLVGADLGLTELPAWVRERKDEMGRVSGRLYGALFEALGSSESPDTSAKA